MTGYILAYSLLGVLLARIDGGLFVVPKIITRLLIMVPITAACYLFAGWYCLFAFLGIFGLITGHGQYFLKRMPKYIKHEKMDFIVKLVFGEDPRTRKDFYNANKALKELMIKAYGNNKLYWRCVFGMFITGTMLGLPGMILALAYGQWLIAFGFAFTGFAKAAAYVVGYEMFDNTESAEYINGFMRSFVLACTFVPLILGVYNA